MSNYRVNLRNENLFLRDSNGNTLQTLRIVDANDVFINDDSVQVYTEDSILDYEIRSGRLILVKSQRL